MTASNGRDLEPRGRAAIAVHKWTAAIVVVIGCGITSAIALHAAPTYTGHIAVKLDGAESDSSTSSWASLVHARVVLEYVIINQQLWLKSDPSDSAILKSFRLDTAFAAGKFTLVVDDAGRRVRLMREGPVVQDLDVGAAIGSPFGFLWQPDARVLPAGKKVDFEVLPSAIAVPALDAGMAAAISRDTLHVRYTGTDRALVGRILNATAYRFVDIALHDYRDADRENHTRSRLRIADAHVIGSAQVPEEPSSGPRAEVWIAGIASSLILAACAAVTRTRRS